TVPKAHKLLGGVFGIHKLYELLDNGYIPYTIVNGKKVIKFADLREFVDSLFVRKIDEPSLQCYPIDYISKNISGGLYARRQTTSKIKTPLKRGAKICVDLSKTQNSNLQNFSQKSRGKNGN
ncbi:MAG: hypothetical protein N2560_01630, partial [Ignavibacteria bacterium]|nr:hypothetical protein [Ignavibacteria bacterium]